PVRTKAATQPARQPSTLASQMSFMVAQRDTARGTTVGLRRWYGGEAPMSFRPRRSVLYMPGSNVRAIAKARTLPVDCIVLDLEDSVAPEAKMAARVQVADAPQPGGVAPREAGCAGSTRAGGSTT